MKKPVFAIYDRPSGLFEKPMVFDIPQQGIAGIRRDVRDMYIKDTLTYDALRDRDLYQIAEYDTITGTFENVEPSEQYHQNFSSFVSDIGVKDEIPN